QPMGFYHSATVVNDARRHGVRVLPVDVTRSNWPCTLEQREGVWVVRLGLRFVKGLRERAGQALVAARAARAFASAPDLAARARTRWRCGARRSPRAASRGRSTSRAATTARVCGWRAA